MKNLMITLRSYRHRQTTPGFTTPPALGANPFGDLTLHDPFVLWGSDRERFVIAGAPGHGKTVGR